MEGDKMEVSEEDLHNLIREEVQRSQLVSPDVLEKTKMLQCMLENRQKQAARLLKLNESVAACEAIVKKQFSVLGWEYSDTDSDDEQNNMECGTSTGSLCDSVHSNNQDKHSTDTQSPSSVSQMLQNNKQLNTNKGKSSSVVQKREPVVVLTRIPQFKLNALLLTARKRCCSRNKLLGSLDNDVHWQQKDDSTDSSISSFKAGSKNKRKLGRKKKRPTKARETPRDNPNTEVKSNTMKTSTFQANPTSDAKNSTANPPKASTMYTGCKTSVTETNSSETTTAPKNANATKKPSPSEQQVEIHVDMYVLARRKEMSWERGQIKEIQTKEDGRVKYKFCFENKGKILVSGHHIALDCMAKADLLFVGARVVIKCPDDQRYCPGILGEMPNRKNRMRFLVFTDDHKPYFISLPLIHLVYKPLPDPLDDIRNISHRNFMKEYLENWPYPPQAQYRVGQMLRAELNGVLERGEVLAVDCSLIQVMFQKDKQKDWIYRGSLRLEHMILLKEKWKGTKDLVTSTKRASH